MLHGWGASGEAVGSIVNGLRSSCTVYAPDLPGFGESDPPPVPWGARDYAEWVRELMAGLGITRASFIAHSHGGRIAIELAAEDPDMVDRLILVDAAGIRARRTFTWYRKVAMAKLAKHVLRRLGTPGNRLAGALVGRAASADYAATSAVMRPTFVRLVNHDLRPLLPRVKAPTLLIWGENDEDTPLSDGEAMERSSRTPASSCSRAPATSHTPTNRGGSRRSPSTSWCPRPGPSRARPRVDGRRRPHPTRATPPWD